MTPIRRQYLKIKHSYPDAIVLFRLGDFYETFDDDARLASRELEITLTSRNMGKNLRVPMAGVPAHSLESYLARLIKRGHKVAICEQLTDPSLGKGLVDRDVVRVVTPGTVLESAILDQDSNNYLAAVIDDGSKAGLAYVDISTGEFAATQLDLERLPQELERINPAEVLTPVPDSSPDGGGAPEAWNGQEAQGSRFTATPAGRELFDFDRGSKRLLELHGILSLESLGCQSLPLLVQASGAVIRYLDQTQKGRELSLATLNVYSTESYMALDFQTRSNLELFQAGRWGSGELSLLSALDQTRTPMGSRLLRRWLAQPLLQLEPLEQRLDGVEFFFGDAALRSAAGARLGQVPDLERILSRVTAGTVAPRDLLALARGLEAAGELSTLLPGSGSGEPLAWLQKQLPSLSEVSGLIGQALAEEPSGPVGEGNVIRQGFDPELDRLRSAGRDARGFIADLERQERERTGIKNLKVGYNQVFGYYIEASKANAGQVPEDYVRRQTLTNAERYIVPQLKEYESLVLNARERIEETEQAAYRRVCGQIAQSGKGISVLAQGVAQLDVFRGLAQTASDYGYVRPELDLANDIIIEGGRHPVVERVLPPGAYVPNDASLKAGEAPIVVLTGPNMAGKSTFIRQVAVITLMAQVGSFVPASRAVIGLVDRIFTRVGLQDDLGSGQSTFMVEMVETAAILNQATSRSLVILDEVGRGTSTYDGMSIARSVIEHLHNDPRLGCKTLFATHYHELTELAASLPGVRNFSVAVTEEEGDVVFLHRIVPGGADKSYGVHVARLAGLPKGVISRAWEVLADLETGGQPNGKGRTGKARTSPKTQGRQMGLFAQENPVVEEVLKLDISNLTPLEAINTLYQLQQKAREA